MNKEIILNSIFFIIIIVGSFITGLIVGDVGTVYISPENLDNNIQLIFGEKMSEQEISDAKTLVNMIDKEYFPFIKNIHFGTNLTELGLDSEVCKKAFNTSCAGMYEDGEITIAWKSISMSKINLCHEILHGPIKSKSNNAQKIEGKWVFEDKSHEIIKDMARKGVCYG